MKRAGFLSGCLVAAALLGCVEAEAWGQAVPVKATDTTGVKAPFVPHYYHLVFVVKELEAGRVVNSRDYAMSIGTVENPGNNYNPRSIRTGTKVPVEEQGKMSYLDVGVSIDCRSVMDLGGRLGMTLGAEISSIQSTSAEERARMQAAGQGSAPMIQQNKWNSEVVVVLGKPTVLFASDEVTSKRTLQLELTATEIP